MEKRKLIYRSSSPINAEYELSVYKIIDHDNLVEIDEIIEGTTHTVCLHINDLKEIIKKLNQT